MGANGLEGKLMEMPAADAFTLRFAKDILYGHVKTEDKVKLPVSEFAGNLERFISSCK